MEDSEVMSEPEEEEEDHAEETPEENWDTVGADVNDEKIVLNVGGIKHETLLSALASKTDTRLYRLAIGHPKGKRNEYFFDRHPGVFGTVMDYYRSGELHVPLDVCGAVVKRELHYWGIDDCHIEACCWTRYSSYIDNQKILADFNENVAKETSNNQIMTGTSGWKKQQFRIWMILDDPSSSKLALGYAVTSFLFVLASIAGFCAETLPVMNIEVNVTRSCSPTEPPTTTQGTSPHPVLNYLDYICTAFFTIELFVRIIFAPSKLRFFRSLMNIIDILALLPLYVQIILEFTDRYNCLKNHRAVLETIFILRIIRIFRIFHLMKHYKALKILVHAIRASIQELLMLSIFLFIAMLVFSTLIFYAERPGPFETGDFNTIPVGFWWSIITMTTVGYGDVYPVTPLGCGIGALCAVCGVLLVALTIPVISNNFTLFYMHARTREQIAKMNSEKSKLKQKKLKKGKKTIPAVKGDKECSDSTTKLVHLDSNSTENTNADINVRDIVMAIRNMEVEPQNNGSVKSNEKEKKIETDDSFGETKM